MRRSLKTILSAAALAILVSCGGDGGGGGGGPITGPKPVPGELTATFTGPHSDDRAILLSITGPGALSNAVTANGVYAVFAQPSSGKITVAIFGALSNGPLVRFSVPDVAQVGAYSATVTDAVDPSNNPRATLAGYTVTIAK